MVQSDDEDGVEKEEVDAVAVDEAISCEIVLCSFIAGFAMNGGRAVDSYDTHTAK